MSLRTLARAAESARAGKRPTLWFDLGSPFTYLHAERADRLLSGLAWRPVLETRGTEEVERAVAEAEAEARGVPLVWPEERGAPKVRASRVAALACDIGRGAEFVLAATRLAYGGGYDLEDLDVLAVAAAAAHIDRRQCASTAEDDTHDRSIRAWSARCDASGVALPAVEFDGQWYVFVGEDRVAAAGRTIDGAVAAERERSRAGVAPYPGVPSLGSAVA